MTAHERVITVEEVAITEIPTARTHILEGTQTKAHIMEAVRRNLIASSKIIHRPISSVKTTIRTIKEASDLDLVQAKE